MLKIDPLDTLYIITAFLFQIVLIVHFALRKWSFDTAIHYGPIVYALSIHGHVLLVSPDAHS